MDLGNLLHGLLLVLAATAITVMLFDRLGLGSVIAFILAGVLIGPQTPGPVAATQVDELQGLAELGVVLFMFTVGLEMRPRQFWAMRRELFGLGWGQLVLTAAVFVPFFVLVRNLEWHAAVMVGLAYAMSSTAVVMAILSDRGELSHSHGRNSVAVLMAQDLAVVPVMALIPVLAHVRTPEPASPLWHKVLSIAAVLTGLVLVGRLVLPRLLGWAARHRSDTAFGILLFLGVIGAAWVVDLVGISMTLGTFLLGMLFSATDYRYQIASTIAPFKATLMAVFFLSVGISIDLHVLAAEWPTVLGVAAAVIVLKTALLTLLCRAFRFDWRTSIRTGTSLSQVGEFSFVLITATSAAGLLTARSVSLGYLVISITMIATPLVIVLGDRITRRVGSTSPPAEDMPPTELENHLVVVGLDEVGFVIAMMAHRAGIPHLAIDRDYGLTVRARRAGLEAFYGDILTPSIQQAAGVSRARSVFLSTTDMVRLRTVALYLQQRYPALDIYARVRSLEEQDALRAHGIRHAGTTYLESTLFRGQSLLRGMGVADEEVQSIADDLRKTDYELIRAAFKAARTADATA